MAERPRFLCDEMAAGLARWLRAAGYDAETAAPGAADGRLLRRAHTEGRWFLTRDRKIAEHKAAAGVLLTLDGERVDDWARQLGARLGLAWTRHAFTRCLRCNTPLRPLPAGERGRLPAGRRQAVDVRWCPRCRQPYWAGDHVRRMRRRLARWQAWTDDYAR